MGTAAEFLHQELLPAIAWVEQTVGLVPPMSREARIMLLVIPGQESLWENVQQGGNGPGRGFYQIEPPTCGLILRNPACTAEVRRLCFGLSVPLSGDAIYAALLSMPKLQVGMARCDLWCDPYPLPKYGDARAAWLTYKKAWGPGKPHPAVWDGIYAQALAADQGA